MAMTVDDFIDGVGVSNTTQQDVSVPTTLTVEEFIDSGTTFQAEQDVIEEGLEPILEGMPNNGRILRDNKTNKLYYSSTDYSTGNQDEIKGIIDSFKKGDFVDPAQQATSRMNRDYLETLPESGLIAQQFFSGGAGGGSWLDENITDSETERRKLEKVREDYETEYPWRAYPAQIAGLGTSAYMLGGIPNLATKAPIVGERIGQGINSLKNWYQGLPSLGKRTTEVVGTSLGSGVEGLIYGAGKGNNADERVTQALQTGGLNTVITAPIAIAFPFIGNLMGRYKVETAQINAIAEEFSIGVAAARQIKKAFDSGNTLAEMLQNVARTGDQRMIADANQAFGKLLDAAGTVSPQISGEIQSKVGGRVQDTSKKLATDLDTTLGTQPQGTQTILESVAESTKTARKEAYDKANAFPVDYNTKEGQEIIRTLRLLDKTTIDKVNKLFAMQGKKVRIKYKGVDRNGNLVFDDLPNTEALNLLKIQLDKVVEGGTDPITKSLLDIDVMLAESARNSIRDNLKKINPYYADALKQGQGKILTQKAILLGQKMLSVKTTADDVKIFMRTASQEEIKGLQQGLREQIENTMANAKRASTTGRSEEIAEAMKIVTDMSSRSVRVKMEQILGPRTADALFRRLDETRAALELQAITRTGSGTESRKQIIDAVEGGIERGALGTLFEGKPVEAMGKLRDFFTGSGTDYVQEQKELIFKEVADLLTKTGKGSQDVDLALRYLEKVRLGENLSKPQASFMAKMITGLFSAPGTTGVGTQRYILPLLEEK